MLNPTSPPFIIQNRYRLVEWLGKGSMGSVYRAKDDMLDRQVVIKFITWGDMDSSERKARILREARAAARLSHPNIMAIYDIGYEQGWDYLILEYIPGSDVNALRKERGGRFVLNEALEITRSVLGALGYAHQQGIIHRDIKPDNIRIMPSGQTKVMDFSLALVPDEIKLTQEGALVGTPIYISPERITHGHCDARADLYAVGAMLYEMLTGQPPFTGETLGQLIAQIIHGTFEPPQHLNSEIPTSIEQVILRLLAYEPEVRYASAEETLEALSQAEALAQNTPASSPSSLMIVNPASGTASAIEADRRRLAAQIQASVIEPIELLLSQATIFEQTMAAQPSTRMAISVLAALARQVMQQATDLEASLHPKILETRGLETALDALADQATRSHGLRLALDLERLVTRLPLEIELALFRSIQEILEALRGQRVSQVTLRLAEKENRITLEINLPGSGYLAEGVLAGIRQRISPHGGEINHTHNQAETSLKIIVPLQDLIQFTLREEEILNCLVEGLSNKEIAQRFSISPRTVNFHLDNIFSKLGVSSRTEAAVWAMRRGQSA